MTDDDAVIWHYPACGSEDARLELAGGILGPKPRHAFQLTFQVTPPPERNAIVHTQRYLRFIVVTGAGFILVSSKKMEPKPNG